MMQAGPHDRAGFFSGILFIGGSYFSLHRPVWGGEVYVRDGSYFESGSCTMDALLRAFHFFTMVDIYWVVRIQWPVFFNVSDAMD